MIQYYRKYPFETRGTVLGLAIGILLGFFVGGAGLVAMGGGWSVPTATVLGMLFGLIGNRIGISRDRRVEKKRLVD